jgi:hypothetical protein
MIFETISVGRVGIVAWDKGIEVEEGEMRARKAGLVVCKRGRRKDSSVAFARTERVDISPRATRPALDLQTNLPPPRAPSSRLCRSLSPKRLRSFLPVLRDRS